MSDGILRVKYDEVCVKMLWKKNRNPELERTQQLGMLTTEQLQAVTVREERQNYLCF